MLFIITMIVCLISSLFFKNTKIIGFFSFLVLGYLAGSANPNTTLDYVVYQAHYNQVEWEVSPFEKGYTLLSKIFAERGVSYADFRFIFAMLAVLILFFGVVSFTKRVALFSFLYGITVFFNDATQIRNLMMIALVVAGTGLLTSSKKSIKLTGILFMLLATQMHDLGFVFAVIIIIGNFVDITKIKKLYRALTYILILIGVFLSVGSSLPTANLIATLLTKFSSRTSSAENVLNNFSRGTSLTSEILIWILLILLVEVNLIFIKKYNELPVEKQTKLKLLFIGSSVSMVVAVLIILAPDYSRISRNAFLFLILLICFSLDNFKFKINTRSMVFFSLIVVLCSGTAYVNNTIWGSEYENSILYLAQIKK